MNDDRLRSLQNNVPLSDQAYTVIRDAIAVGDIKPGERLTERDLAAQLNVSPTPVREALRRLEQEGLVERSSVRKLYVSEMSAQAVSELLMMQAALRGVAARLATEKITDAELDEIDDILQQSIDQLDYAPAETLIALSARFHAIINQASRNPVLISFLDTTQVFSRSQRMRVLDEKRVFDRELLAEHYAEHRMIAEALRARDADRAEALMRQHTLQAGALLQNAVSDEE